MGQPGGMAMPGGSGPGGEGMQDDPESPLDELDFYTGELGSKLLTKLKTKMEASTFGAVLKDANKAVPLVLKANNDTTTIRAVLPAVRQCARRWV